MRIVDRYVVGTVIRHFCYALAALLAVFAVINLTEELRSAGRPGWGVGAALWFVVLTLPSEAYDLFPAAALVGAVLALGRMASDNEILALQAAAVSRSRIIMPALTGAGILALVGAALGDMIAAPLSQRAHSQRALALSGGRVLSTSSGLWLREGGRFVNIGAVGSDGSLAEVYLFDFDGDRDLERFVHARTAIETGGRWRLQDLHETTFDHDVSENRWAPAAPWNTTIDAKQIRSLWVEPRDLSAATLHRAILSLRERGQNPLVYEVAFWRRMTMPVYMGVMVLLAVPIVLASGRAVRVGERATVGALVGLGFQMLQGMFTNLGIVAGFPPLVTVLVPAFLAIGAVGALFRSPRLQ